MTDLERSIMEMREARDIHQGYVNEWLAEMSEYEVSLVGDGPWHLAWVDKYDRCIGLLEKSAA